MFITIDYINILFNCAQLQLTIPNELKFKLVLFNYINMC